MHKRFLKSFLNFLVVFSLTLVVIVGFSKISTQWMSVSQKDSANTAYIETPSENNAEQSQEIRAVVVKESNILPSVGAFLLLTAIPILYVVFVVRKKKRDPNYFASSAQRYSPKQEITFSNNTFTSEYNRSRM